MPILRLLMGALLLFFGRALYWLFVAVSGFLVGFELGTQLLANQPEGVRILIAAVGGIIGALLGMLAQRLAFTIGGFFAGGYLALAAAHEAGVQREPLVWFVVGAILGAIVAALIMDWAIIVLSSLAGAAVIVGEFNLDATAAALVFVVLTAIGIFVQARRLQGTPPPATRTALE